MAQADEALAQGPADVARSQDSHSHVPAPVSAGEAPARSRRPSLHLNLRACGMDGCARLSEMRSRSSERRESDREIDPLTEVLQDLRLSGSFYCRTELGAPWGLGIPRRELAAY